MYNVKKKKMYCGGNIQQQLANWFSFCFIDFEYFKISLNIYIYICRYKKCKIVRKTNIYYYRFGIII
jgi:hypothetical protein